MAVGSPAKPVKAVDNYIQAKRHRWVDTRDLTPEAKRDLLRHRLPR